MLEIYDNWHVESPHTSLSLSTSPYSAPRSRTTSKRDTTWCSHDRLREVTSSLQKLHPRRTLDRSAPSLLTESPLAVCALGQHTNYNNCTAHVLLNHVLCVTPKSEHGRESRPQRKRNMRRGSSSTDYSVQVAALAGTPRLNAAVATYMWCIHTNQLRGVSQ